jgi:hypothetical protein
MKFCSIFFNLAKQRSWLFLQYLANTILLNRIKWADIKCDCRYHCYHIFVGTVYEKLISIPMKFKNCKIGQKPLLGRKPKAKAGDTYKRN